MIRGKVALASASVPSATRQMRKMRKALEGGSNVLALQAQGELLLVAFKRMSMLLLAMALMATLAVATAEAQQVPDNTYNPPIENPAYPTNGGPVVAIDEAHHNFHTMEGRYKPFATLLQRDGYVVKPSRSQFSAQSLQGIDVLVIANPLAQSTAAQDPNYTLPTPSAFTDAEIEAVRTWVLNGGSLWLVADHMPWPGATEKLAAAFGVRMNNGFAMNEEMRDPTFFFRRSDGSLAANPITDGRTATERVDSLASYTGSAFWVDENRNAEPLLLLDADAVSIMPTVAWQWGSEAPRVPVGGWYQGAAMRAGEGRVAVFGEAAMFTAQLRSDGSKMGMNAPYAEENYEFVLNVSHWLSGLLGPDATTNSTEHPTRKSGPDRAAPMSPAGESHPKGGEAPDAGVFTREDDISRRFLGAAVLVISGVLLVFLVWYVVRELKTRAPAERRHNTNRSGAMKTDAHPNSQPGAE